MAHFKKGFIYGIPYVELPGKKFGHLTINTVLDKRDKSGKLLCSCICDCGNGRIVPITSVISGIADHCTGCKLYTKVNPLYKDLTGQQFGDLTVLKWPIKV